MENRVEIPETGRPEQGRVLSPFELTPERVEMARALVINNLDRFKSQREQWRTKNLIRDRAYRAILEPPRDHVSTQQISEQVGRAYVGLDDKASPIIHDNTEAIKARLKESIIPINNEFVKVESADMQLSEVRGAELNQQLYSQDIERKLDIIAHNAAVYGTFFISVPLVNDQDVVFTRQLVTVEQPIIDNEGKPVLDTNGNPMIQQVQSLENIREVDNKYFGPGYETR